MNQRIKELAEQASHQSPDGYPVTIPFSKVFAEKFAELIVGECMRMCEVTEMSFVTHNCDVEASGAITVRQFIAEHFEVGDMPAPLKQS